ncbi:MAG: hypothetical protein ACLPN6_15875 [Streptosporangiaceae bacterium]|jgi:hypothetical protein
MSESSQAFDAEVTDHQVILRAGQVEAVVVPLEEYPHAQGSGAARDRAVLVAHQSRHPSLPGDGVPDGMVYDSIEALVADLGAGNEECPHARVPDRPAPPA